MLSKEQQQEAQRLSQYLVGESAPPQAVVDYWSAIDRLQCGLTEQERYVWARMMQSQIILRSVDAGLALLRPASELRKRIFIMLAILETEPALADRFLPIDRSPTYLVVIGWKGVRAVLSALVGLILVKLWRLA